MSEIQKEFTAKGISLTAFKKTRIEQETPETHLKLIDPSSLKMPEITYQSRKNIEKQVAFIYEEANAKITELLKNEGKAVEEHKDQLVN